MATFADDPGPFAWVLNLDADLELAMAPRAFTPTASVRAMEARRVPALAATLLEPGDVLVDARTRACGLRGRAFSPTPNALRALARAGAILEPAPDVACLRRVTSRAFAAALGSTLPGARFVSAVDDAVRLLADAPPLGTAWRVKRAFGMSGRGQRIVTPGVLTRADRTMLASAIAEDGVQIEPDVTIVTEYGMHGFLAPGGALAIGALVRQRCDARGAWLATERATDEDHDVARALRAEVERAAAALARAGYFGPFGVDAFTYRGPGDALALQPRSEVNARYGMGFGVGFGRADRAAAAL